MGVSQGFGKTSSEGLVFGYDTRDSRNSYKGAPGTNIAAGPSRNYNGTSLSTYSNGKLFSSNGYTETVYIPTLGYRQVESVEIYNVYSSYGADGNYNCCPSLFSYAGGQDFTGGTTYTYQIIYKCHSGYTHPNYMYHYEYGPSGYITEYGVHTTGQREHLGDGWYHAWATFTTNAATTSGHKGMWYYQYNVRDKVSVAAISIIPGDIVRPPLQFIEENTTRSATQGLLDLKGNSTIDLSNVSFDSNAQMTFDGTNDYVDLGSYLTGIDTSVLSIELVFRSNIVTGTYQPLLGWMENEYPHGYICTGDFTGAWGNESISFYNEGPGTTGLSFAYTNGHAFLNDSNYHHVVFILQTGGYKIYVDGSEVPVNASFRNGSMLTTMPSNLFGYGSTPSVIVGAGSSPASYANARVPIVKIYNRALPAAEVAQNYRHYKSRYNI